MRAEAVERAQAGDKCDFTGTLIVVPDVSVLNLPGARAESSSRHKGKVVFFINFFFPSLLKEGKYFLQTECETIKIKTLPFPIYNC